MPKIKIYDNLILENNWFWPTPTKVNSRCTFSKSLTSFVGFERTFKSRSHINKISGIICCSAINTEMGNKDFKKEVWIYLADLANINQSKSSQETFLFSTLVDKGIGSSTGRGGGLGTTKDLGQLGTWKTLGLGTSRRTLNHLDQNWLALRLKREIQAIVSLVIYYAKFATIAGLARVYHKFTPNTFDFTFAVTWKTAAPRDRRKRY